MHDGGTLECGQGKIQGLERTYRVTYVGFHYHT